MEDQNLENESNNNELNPVKDALPEEEEMEKDVQFLFDISKEVKLFYETPVVFLTKKDYSDPIFNAMCLLRRALFFENSTKNQIIDMIVDVHLNWLHTVRELEKFKNKIREIPREEIYDAIKFTVDALNARLKYYKRYMEKYKVKLSNKQIFNVLADLEIVEEMHQETLVILQKKMKCFKSFTCTDEFVVQVKEATAELLLWLDKIHDYFSLQLSNYINVYIPNLDTDLPKTLQQIVESFQSSNAASVQEVLEQLKSKGLDMSAMIRVTTGHNLEIMKVIEKINVLDDRISRLESEPSSAALLALQHKKQYLQTRLKDLESQKTTISKINEEATIVFDHDEDENICTCEDFFRLRIFNHLLPSSDREHLVTELCYLWDLAVFGEKSSRKSIISIMSAADGKEEYIDSLGTYHIDTHGRRIYKRPDHEELYQSNEHNELVPLSDDSEHIYFYDECGRYFIDATTKDRIYKAHASASEYMMDSSGVLLKVKEEREGITYYYDNYGRYYIDEDGKNIYREADSTSEYENDGLGNLVRIRSQLDYFELCPDEPRVTEDFKYLKANVGAALRICIADTILHQPADPVKYLSARLIKYRENIELRDRWAREKEELDVEREIAMAEERAAREKAERELALLMQGGSEASYDSHMVNYSTSRMEAIISNVPNPTPQ